MQPASKVETSSAPEPPAPAIVQPLAPPKYLLEPPPYTAQANSAAIYQQDQAVPAANQMHSHEGRNEQKKSIVHVTMAESPPIICQNDSHDSYHCHLVVACTVVVLINLIFGLLALYLAIAAERSKKGNREKARQLGRASFAVSIVGIFVSAGVLVFLLINYGFSDPYNSSAISSGVYDTGGSYSPSGSHCWGCNGSSGSNSIPDSISFQLPMVSQIPTIHQAPISPSAPVLPQDRNFTSYLQFSKTFF
jgi:hypothetical protein